MRILLAFLMTLTLAPCAFPDDLPSVPHDAPSAAQQPQNDQSSMRVDRDGVILPDEYEVLTENGALTRRRCPHTCEDRNLPRKFCREWKSKDQTLCYVWDTRLPQDAVPAGK